MVAIIVQVSTVRRPQQIPYKRGVMRRLGEGDATGLVRRQRGTGAIGVVNRRAAQELKKGCSRPDIGRVGSQEVTDPAIHALPSLLGERAPTRSFALPDRGVSREEVKGGHRIHSKPMVKTG